MVGRLIPAGTGFAYHQEKRAKKERELAMTKEAKEDNVVTARDVESALSEALISADEASKESISAADMPKDGEIL